MRFSLALLTLACVAALGAGAYAADTMAAKPTVYAPDSIKWMDGTGPLKGAQVAVLSGDPMKAGPFVMRIKFPDGMKVVPHTHPDAEQVTILSGSLLFGVGDTLDPSKAMTASAGTFASIPAGIHHFVIAKGETIVQVYANGPFVMTPVKP